MFAGRIGSAGPNLRWPGRDCHQNSRPIAPAALVVNIVAHFAFSVRFLTKETHMSAQQKATELGIDLSAQEKGYLNLCIRSGYQLITSGHVSDIKGILGDDLAVEDGYKAARECAEKILRSVHNTHGTLDGLKVVKLLGCVYSAPGFTDQHLVINGASDLFHQLYGKDGDGYHARSALGFAALPTGVAVEVEAIFEIL